MGGQEFQSYLRLLRDLCGVLDTLTKIEQDKARAVRNDDLADLNECMKKEQALTMSLRGYDQKRQTALDSIGLSGVPLSQLAARAPEDCRDETRKVAEELRLQYTQFLGAAEVARDTLECNLHQIETILQKLEADETGRDGYEKKDPHIPPALGADFRA